MTFSAPYLIRPLVRQILFCGEGGSLQFVIILTFIFKICIEIFDDYLALSLKTSSFLKILGDRLAKWFKVLLFLTLNVCNC